MSHKAFTNPKELAERVDLYFAVCEASRTERELKSGDIRVRQTLPSFVGLANYLGVAKSTLQLYADGKYDLTAEQLQDIVDKHNIGLDDIQNYSAVLARARDRIEQSVLTAAINGDTDSRIALAMLAKFGYSTKVETESKATLTVQWEGADMADVGAWGK